jgi:hypothetical protein
MSGGIVASVPALYSTTAPERIKGHPLTHNNNGCLQKPATQGIGSSPFKTPKETKNKQKHTKYTNTLRI